MVIGWRDWSPSHLLNRWREEFKEFKEFGSSGVRQRHRGCLPLRCRSYGGVFESGSRRTVPEAQSLPQSSVKIQRWFRERLFRRARIRLRHPHVNIPSRDEAMSDRQRALPVGGARPRRFPMLTQTGSHRTRPKHSSVNPDRRTIYAISEYSIDY